MSCGQFAIADLHAWMLGEPWMSDSQIASFSDGQLARFVRNMRDQVQVPSPCCVAGGPSDWLEGGLALLLKDKGVPAVATKERASAAIRQIGASKLQQAMQSKNPWKELKALGNQVVPAFQFVLPSELQGAVQARAASGEALPSRRKQRQPHPLTTHMPRAKPAPALPGPEAISLPKGVFVSSDGPLEQVTLEAVGPDTQGVLVLSIQATAYAKVAKPVSRKALGILVLGSAVVEGATVPYETLRFTATLICTQEPLLLPAVLYQIGSQSVAKFTPAQKTKVDLTPSRVVRILVFRDEIPTAWQDFTRAPVRAALELLPQLQTCRLNSCSCHKWHRTDSPGEPPALLERWGRSFLKGNMKPEAPSTSEVFSFFCRVPSPLLDVLLAASGTNATYAEPRDDQDRRSFGDYRVIWMPKTNLQEVMLFKQTHAQAIGIARMSQRYGVRCSLMLRCFIEP